MICFPFLSVFFSLFVFPPFICRTGGEEKYKKKKKHFLSQIVFSFFLSGRVGLWFIGIQFLFFLCVFFCNCQTKQKQKKKKTEENKEKKKQKKETPGSGRKKKTDPPPRQGRQKNIFSVPKHFCSVFKHKNSEKPPGRHRPLKKNQFFLVSKNVCVCVCVCVCFSSRLFRQIQGQKNLDPEKNQDRHPRKRNRKTEKQIQNILL